LPRKIGLPNSGWITNVHDTLGRLADTSLRSSANVVLNQRQYQYPGHLRSKMTRTDGSCQDYTHDGGGNITALVALNQTLSAIYKYDPYGRSVSSSGSMAAANTQRWLNRDPIEEAGGINLYAFAGRGPVNAVDPFGLSILDYIKRFVPRSPRAFGYPAGMLVPMALNVSSSSLPCGSAAATLADCQTCCRARPAAHGFSGLFAIAASGAAVVAIPIVGPIAAVAAGGSALFSIASYLPFNHWQCMEDCKKKHPNCRPATPPPAASNPLTPSPGAYYPPGWPGSGRNSPPEMIIFPFN
jgi:hypothetical protein